MCSMSKALVVSFLVFAVLFSTCTAVREDECKLCNDAAKQFHEGIAKTVNHNFGGGNTAWEERKLGTYARSETRLLTILEEHVCSSGDSYKCHHFVEKHEPEIENWWFEVFAPEMPDSADVNGEKSLRSHLCVERLKLCCASGRYGEECEHECTETTCNGHGKCVVDGTRSNSRKCECDEQTVGSDCEQCKTGWFRLPQDAAAATFECAECSPHCDACSNESSNCERCAAGFEKKGPTNVCVDVDECADSAVCEALGDPDSTQCVNTAGSYQCECASGFVLDKPTKETAADDDDDDDDDESDSKTKTGTGKCISIAEMAQKTRERLSAKYAGKTMDPNRLIPTDSATATEEHLHDEV